MYMIHSGRLNRTSPTISHRSDENEHSRSSQMAGRKKIHSLRPFRRGFHVGSPLERFHHSLAEYNGFFYELRITNNEPQPFEGRSCALFPESVTAKPLLSPNIINVIFFSEA